MVSFFVGSDLGLFLPVQKWLRPGIKHDLLLGCKQVAQGLVVTDQLFQDACFNVSNIIVHLECRFFINGSR